MPPRNHGEPRPAHGAIVRQCFGETHADAGADRRGKANKECLPVVMCCKRGRKQRRQRRYGAVHQARKTWLDILQDEHPVAGVVLDRTNVGRQDGIR